MTETTHTLEASSECPICAWPQPHSHTAEEIAERPEIDNARIAFEKEAREFMASSYFKGPRTGYWWSRPAWLARGSQLGAPPFDKTRFYDWASRMSPTGCYQHEFVEIMWRYWRMAWLSARGKPVSLPESVDWTGHE